MVKNNQDNDFNGNKLKNIDSITIIRNPPSSNEIANKKNFDDELDRKTIVKFNQILQNYLKVSVGIDIYNLSKYKKLSITDITEIKFPNIGPELLQKGNIYCNNKIDHPRINYFIRSTGTNSPTVESGAASLSPIGNMFMCIETSGNNSGNDKIFVSWQRTDIIQITKITFYYKRFSVLTHPQLKNLG